jgi:hypothetical protein
MFHWSAGLSEELILVTHNEREFQRIPGIT